MIKCKLIDITTDNRAFISIDPPEGENGKLVQTRPIDWIDYRSKEFHVGGKLYNFSGPMLP